MQEAKFDRMVGQYDPNMDREDPTPDELEIIAECDPALAHELAQVVDLEGES